jgi:hypothetical protein
MKVNVRIVYVYANGLRCEFKADNIDHRKLKDFNIKKNIEEINVLARKFNSPLLKNILIFTEPAKKS